MNKLTEHAKDRNNNFNLIRFILATLVIFSHSYGMIGIEHLEPLSKLTVNISFGSFAVDAFFVISGFLVSNSITHGGGGLLQFFAARILRIYPALIVSVFFTVFIIGTIYTTNSLTNYLLNADIYIYIIKNATFLFSLTPEYYLPGMFESNLNHSTTINASLWSLPWETRLYLILGILAFVFNHKISKSVIIIAICSYLFYMLNYWFNFTGQNLQTFIRVFTLFFIGSSFFFLKDKIVMNYNRKDFFFITLSLVIYFILLILEDKKLLFIFYNLTLGYFVLYLAYFPSKNLIKFNNIGDYSYGLYIYSFPIQQAICVSLPNMNLIPFFIVSFSITLICAILSWHFIEKPCLKMKTKF